MDEYQLWDGDGKGGCDSSYYLSFLNFLSIKYCPPNAYREVSPQGKRMDCGRHKGI